MDGVGSLYLVLDCLNQATIVQVDEKGLLSSGSLTGSSSLLVTSQETFGVNQTLVLAVKVVPVSYLCFSTSPILHRDSLSAIPLGMVLPFTVHLHANTGEVLQSHLPALVHHQPVVVEGATRTEVVRGDKDSRVLLTTRENGNKLIGSWSSTQTESIALLHPESSVSCLLSFTSDAVEFSAHGVYLTNTSLDPSTGFYSCSLTLQPLSDQQTRLLSLSMTSLLVMAGVKGSAFSGEQVCARLPETGLYSDQTELLLRNLQPSGELTVYGPAAALDSLKLLLPWLPWREPISCSAS